MPERVPTSPKGDVVEKLDRTGLEIIPTFSPDSFGWVDPIQQPAVELMIPMVVSKLYLLAAVLAAAVRLHRVHRTRSSEA